MQLVYGQKRKSLFDEFISKHFPSDIDRMTYVEPFGGSFMVSTYLKNRPKKLIYNDCCNYNISIKADEIIHGDYKDVLKRYDSEETFFYFDPPYFGKEEWYGKNKNDFDFHFELFNNINKLKGNYVISYEENNHIRKIWDTHTIIKYSGSDLIFKNEILILKK